MIKYTNTKLIYLKYAKLNIDDGHILVGEESNHYVEGEEVAWELTPPPPTQIFGQMLCREGFVSKEWRLCYDIYVS